EELGDYVRANKLRIEESVHGGLGEDGSQSEHELEQTRLAEALRATGHEVVFDDHGHLDSIGVPVEDSPTGMEPYFLHDPVDMESLPESIRRQVQELNTVSE